MDDNKQPVAEEMQEEQPAEAVVEQPSSSDKPAKKKSVLHRVGKVIMIAMAGLCVIIALIGLFAPNFLAAMITDIGLITGFITKEYHDIVAEKPVIYLYPTEDVNATVELDYVGELTCTYPKYDPSTGWKVKAQSDGTLTDESGLEYNYLYWEGTSDVQYDFSTGFCIKGEDTAEFLEYTLDRLGLSRKEANEFIVYWLPQMEVSNYNLISFQTDVYTDSAKLTITPEPDTLIRVFMAYKPLDTAVEIESQEIITPDREGFTVVEWGGALVTDAEHSKAK